jgi:PAS domain S-box-containing protein
MAISQRKRKLGRVRKVADNHTHESLPGVDCFLQCQPFGLVLNALQDGVTVYDRNGMLIWINTKACEILGLPRTELIGRNVSELATLPTVQAIVSQEFAGCSLSDIRNRKRIEDYVSPGYVEFTNGKSILYMGTDIRDESGVLRYAIYTIRDVTDLNVAQHKIQELQQLTSLYQSQLRTLHQQVLGRDIVYRSASMQKVVARAFKLASLDGNILLTGETGVGKNLLAHYIHMMSQRARGPFIHVNCASLPESLVEAELFGYADGAFTGAARKGRRGLIELGQGGIIFLDEIGDMPPEMQAKLLTVIEDRTLRRIGGEKWLHLDVRFLAATNRSPENLLPQKILRQDLYYRLAENRINLPPLRERPEDIPVLIEHALSEFNEKNRTRLSFHTDLINQVQTFPLPGNVRELKNMVWQIASEVDHETGEITLSQLPADFFWPSDQETRSSGAARLASSRTLHKKIEEEQRLRELHQQYQGDVYAIAGALGVHRTTVTRKLRRYGLACDRRQDAHVSHPNGASPPFSLSGNEGKSRE